MIQFGFLAKILLDKMFQLIFVSEFDVCSFRANLLVVLFVSFLSAIDICLNLFL